MKNDARKYKKTCSNIKWHKTTKEFANNNKFFKLLNNMNRKGKIWVDGENFDQLKIKKPTIESNIEKTKDKWFNFIKNKFDGPSDTSNDD